MSGKHKSHQHQASTLGIWAPYFINAAARLQPWSICLFVADVIKHPENTCKMRDLHTIMEGLYSLFSFYLVLSVCMELWLEMQFFWINVTGSTQEKKYLKKILLRSLEVRDAILYNSWKRKHKDQDFSHFLWSWRVLFRFPDETL